MEWFSSFLFVVLTMESRTSHTEGKHAITKLGFCSEVVAIFLLTVLSGSLRVQFPTHELWDVFKL